MAWTRAPSEQATKIRTHGCPTAGGRRRADCAAVQVSGGCRCGLDHAKYVSVACTIPLEGRMGRDGEEADRSTAHTPTNGLPRPRGRAARPPAKPRRAERPVGSRVVLGIGLTPLLAAPRSAGAALGQRVWVARRPAAALPSAAPGCTAAAGQGGHGSAGRLGPGAPASTALGSVVVSWRRARCTLSCAQRRGSHPGAVGRPGAGLPTAVTRAALARRPVPAHSIRLLRCSQPSLAGGNWQGPPAALGGAPAAAPPTAARMRGAGAMQTPSPCTRCVVPKRSMPLRMLASPDCHRQLPLAPFDRRRQHGARAPTGPALNRDAAHADRHSGSGQPARRAGRGDAGLRAAAAHLRGARRDAWSRAAAVPIKNAASSYP